MLHSLKRSDVPQAVDVHMAAFPSFFLTTLGRRFLSEMYYGFVDDEDSIALITRRDTVVTGVVIGTTRPQAFFSRLLRRRWWRFGLAGLVGCLRRPSAVWRLTRAILYRGDAPPGEGYALLSSIAVAPGFQRHGIGKILVQGWIETVRMRGSRAAYLTTDADHNESVNAFYQKSGWLLERSYVTREGRAMNRYVFDFHRDAS